MTKFQRCVWKFTSLPAFWAMRVADVIYRIHIWAVKKYIFKETGETTKTD